jgi:hypothetical protein
MQNSYISSLSNRKSTLPFAVSLVILASLVIATTVAHGQSPDFSLSSSPSNLCVNPGVNAVAAVTLASVDGFSGTVNLGANVDPSVTNGPTLSPIPSSETLSAGQSVTFNLDLSTTTSTPLYTYSVEVSGLSGGAFHRIVVQLTVAAGCSVGGVVLPTAGLVQTNTFMVSGLIVVGLVGIAGASLAVHATRRKPTSNP